LSNLTNKQFEKYSKLIYENFGIHHTNAKKEMVQSKLSKLMRWANIEDYDDYYDFLMRNCGNENWDLFVNEITTHKTHFFREDSHFEYIRSKIDNIIKNNPRILNNNELRIWSAGCSTGEEPYTIAMILKECLPNYIDVKILATDISPVVIEKAQKGIYLLDEEDGVSAYYYHKYFIANQELSVVVPEIKDLITFRTFNLMNPFPFQNTFDIIFCRNVMIYFDMTVQEQLIKKFYNILTHGGLLFIGLSESLTQRQHKFKYVQPTIYSRTD